MNNFATAVKILLASTLAITSVYAGTPLGSPKVKHKKHKKIDKRSIGAPIAVRSTSSQAQGAGALHLNDDKVSQLKGASVALKSNAQATKSQTDSSINNHSGAAPKFRLPPVGALERQKALSKEKN